MVLILRDLLRGAETWLVDEAMAKNARPGLEMAARLLKPDDFAMTARIVVPVTQDLMDEVFVEESWLEARPGGDPCWRPTLRPRDLPGRCGRRNHGSVRFRRR